MMDFIREGGFAMWLLLVVGVAAVGVAAAAPARGRPAVFTAGCLATLIVGLFGTANGLAAVAAHYRNYAEPVVALGTGIGEVSHIGTLAGPIAAVLGLAALVSARVAAARD